jgi:hypothetical protein
MKLIFLWKSITKTSRLLEKMLSSGDTVCADHDRKIIFIYLKESEIRFQISMKNENKIEDIYNRLKQEPLIKSQEYLETYYLDIDNNSKLSYRRIH